MIYQCRSYFFFYLKCTKTMKLKNVSSLMPTAELFTTAKFWKQLKSPTTDVQIRKAKSYGITVEYYSAVWKGDTLSFATMTDETREESAKPRKSEGEEQISSSEITQVWVIAKTKQRNGQCSLKTNLRVRSQNWGFWKWRIPPLWWWVEDGNTVPQKITCILAN